MFCRSLVFVCRIAMESGDKWPVESVVDGTKLGVRMTGTSEFRMSFLGFIYKF